jgi:Zn-finger nucleic acid-binding protein
MTWIRVGRADLLECAGCDGTWVEAQTFERICADREAQAALVHTTGHGANESVPPVVHGRREGAGGKTGFRYRPCPICGKLMNRLNFGRASGAVVDVCKGHGTFLDRGELHQIVRFIQGGGIDRLRATEREQLTEERRRLQDAGRLHARMFPDRSSHASGDIPVARLLSALLGW